MRCDPRILLTGYPGGYRMTADEGTEGGNVKRGLTRAELADAIPCPVGSVTYWAAIAGVQPLRYETRSGQSWRVWSVDAVAKMRRAVKQRRTAGRARKGGR